MIVILMKIDISHEKKEFRKGIQVSLVVQDRYLFTGKFRALAQNEYNSKRPKKYASFATIS